MQFEKINLTSITYTYNGISIILVLNFNNFEMWAFDFYDLWIYFYFPKTILEIIVKYY